MIVFLNFVPVEFMGGAERWMYKVASYVNKKEETKIISANPSLANLYGKLVLKRDFPIRSEVSNLASLKFGLTAFFPFTKSWRQIRQTLAEARIIYIKGEVIELCICIFFGGPKILKKVIPGLHSPLVYLYPLNFFDKLHKLVYESFLTPMILSRVAKIHVLSQTDQNFLVNKLNLKNVFFVPNSIPANKTKNKILNESKNLKVIFVGELTFRKGLDVLIEVMESSSSKIEFFIVGDGPYIDQIKELEKTHSNIHYLGYLKNNKVLDLYEEMDVIFLPSRAESFPFVFLEALSRGLVLLSSDAAAIDIPNEYIHSFSLNDISKFTEYLEKQRLKKETKLSRKNIISFFEKNFTDERNLPILARILFGL